MAHGLADFYCWPTRGDVDSCVGGDGFDFWGCAADFVRSVDRTACGLCGSETVSE